MGGTEKKPFLLLHTHLQVRLRLAHGSVLTPLFALYIKPLISWYKETLIRKLCDAWMIIWVLILFSNLFNWNKIEIVRLVTQQGTSLIFEYCWYSMHVIFSTQTSRCILYCLYILDNKYSYDLSQFCWLVIRLIAGDLWSTFSLVVNTAKTEMASAHCWFIRQFTLISVKITPLLLSFQRNWAGGFPAPSCGWL